MTSTALVKTPAIPADVPQQQNQSQILLTSPFPSHSPCASYPLQHYFQSPKALFHLQHSAGHPDTHPQQHHWPCMKMISAIRIILAETFGYGGGRGDVFFPHSHAFCAPQAKLYLRSHIGYMTTPHLTFKIRSPCFFSLALSFLCARARQWVPLRKKNCRPRNASPVVVLLFGRPPHPVRRPCSRVASVALLRPFKASSVACKAR